MLQKLFRKKPYLVWDVADKDKLSGKICNDQFQPGGLIKLSAYLQGPTLQTPYL